MSESIFSVQLKHLEQLAKNLDFNESQYYVESFPSNALNKIITKNIPLLFHRQWIRASIHGHFKEISYYDQCLSNGRWDQAQVHLNQAVTWFQQATVIFARVSTLANLSSIDLHNYFYTPAEVQHGDVILSFKLDAYIKRSFVSWQVKTASNSAITHVLVAYRSDPNTVQLLFSGDETNGLGLREMKPAKDEVYLIMRPDPKCLNEQLLNGLSYWKRKAQTDEKSREYVFPEGKVQLANIIGLFAVIFGYFGKSLSIPNLLANHRGVFCSELVDNIFYFSGTQLTPRSQHRAVVGPVELFYSPHLNFIGIISDENVLQLHKEMISQFARR